MKEGCIRPEVDVLSILLSDTAVAESDQDKPGVILDYDAGGNMASFEILDASKRMANPLSVEYAVAPALGRPAVSKPLAHAGIRIEVQSSTEMFARAQYATYAWTSDTNTPLPERQIGTLVRWFE